MHRFVYRTDLTQTSSSTGIYLSINDQWMFLDSLMQAEGIKAVCGSYIQHDGFSYILSVQRSMYRSMTWSLCSPSSRASHRRSATKVSCHFVELETSGTAQRHWSMNGTAFSSTASSWTLIFQTTAVIANLHKECENIRCYIVLLRM